LPSVVIVAERERERERAATSAARKNSRATEASVVILAILWPDLALF